MALRAYLSLALLFAVPLLAAGAPVETPLVPSDPRPVSLTSPAMAGVDPSEPPAEAAVLEPMSFADFGARWEGSAVAPRPKGTDDSPLAEMERLRRLDASLSSGGEPVGAMLDRFFDDESVGTSATQAAFMTAALSAAAGLRRAPRLMVLNEDSAVTAGLSGGNNIVVMHPSLLRDRPRNRVAVILAHEIGHAKDRDWRLTRDIVLIPISIMSTGFGAALSVAGGHAAVLIGATLIATLAAAAAGFRRHAFRHLGEEYRADAIAARLSSDVELVKRTLAECLDPNAEVTRRLERLSRITPRRPRL